MNNKWKTIVGVVAFVVVMGGSVLAYNILSKEKSPDVLVGQRAPSTVAGEHSQPASTNNGGKDASAASQEGKTTPAPNFTVIDTDGNEVSLADFRGKPVVLNFWASWCGPCQSEMPAFEAAYAAEGEEIHFLMVNLTDGSRETVETAKAFVEDAGYTFPVYFDTKVDAAAVYGVRSIPVTYFIDAEGNVVVYGSGALNATTLEKGLSMIRES